MQCSTPRPCSLPRATTPTLSEIRRAASLARKVKAGGRPRSKKKRCFCNQNTLKRATARYFSCCIAAGLHPPQPPKPARPLGRSPAKKSTAALRAA